MSAPQTLRRRLLARIHDSVQAHREYVTVRREQGEWHQSLAGARRRVLWSGPDARVELWRLDAGQALPWPDPALGQEVLVVGGRLDSAEGPLERYDHLVHETGSRLPLAAGPGGAEVYVRQRMAQGPPLEAHWWRLAEGRARRSAGLDRRWRRTAPGVEVLRLAGDAHVVSMLVRFDAGASVPDHGHELDEDCLVLDGEMFLGDILLRAGDYQLAPAGGSHWGEMSDVGCVFFFHGAIDPVLNTKR
jgi:quercetin dioxygenase-like cupin family protein